MVMASARGTPATWHEDRCTLLAIEDGFYDGAGMAYERVLLGQATKKTKDKLISAANLLLPVFVEQAAGGILVDVDGNQLIDLASGIAVTTVGGSHPEVTRRIADQAARFTHTCFMVTEYEGAVRVAEKLNQLTPGDFAKKTALFSTGSEAVENAVKLARSATGRAVPPVTGRATAQRGRRVGWRKIWRSCWSTPSSRGVPGASRTLPTTPRCEYGAQHNAAPLRGLSQPAPSRDRCGPEG